MKSTPFMLRTAFGIIATAAALSLTACSGQGASEPPAAKSSERPVAVQNSHAEAKHRCQKAGNAGRSLLRRV